MAASVLKFGVKAGVAGGAAYTTVNYGVWSGESEQGHQTFNKVKTTVLPAGDEVAKDTTAIKESKQIQVAERWNQGVKSLFTGVSNVPDRTKTMSNKLAAMTNNLVK